MKEITEENFNKSMGQDNSGFLLRPVKFNMETDYNRKIDKSFIKETLKNDHDNEILLVNKFEKTKTNYICRVCLSDENDVELNPLIHPCKCSGTMRYIHIKCLKSWFKAKINIKVFNNLTLYNFKELQCELCSAPIPDYLKVRDIIYDLIEIDKPESNHILFENIRKNNTKNRNIYLYNIGERRSINIGSLDHSDIIIKDSSVSNNHAFLNLFNDSLYLCDNNSKYGTLVLIQNDIMLLLNKTFSFQLKDIIVSFKLKEKNCILSCFHRLFMSKFQANLINKYRDYSEFIEEIMYKSRNYNDVRICSFYNFKEDSLLKQKVDEIAPQHENSRQVSLRSEETNNNKTNIALSKSQDRFLVKINPIKIKLESKVNQSKKPFGTINQIQNINNTLCLKYEAQFPISQNDNKILKKDEKKIKKRIDNQLPNHFITKNSESFRPESRNVNIDKDKEINSA